jgi:hypothetical protein
MVISIKSQIGFGSSSKSRTVDSCQQLFALVLPHQFGYASLLGDVSQLALGHLKFRLEAESVKFPVGHGGVAVQLRGVVWQRLIDRHRRRVPLNKPETNGIVRTMGNLRQVMKRRWRSLPPMRTGVAPFCLVGGATPVVAPRHWFWAALVIGKKSLRLVKI